MLIAIIIAFCVSGLTIFAPLLITLKFSEDLKSDKLYTACMLIVPVFVGMYWTYSNWKWSVFIYWPLPGSVIFDVIVGCIVSFIISFVFKHFRDRDLKLRIAALFLLSSVVILIIIPLVSGSSVLNSKAKADLISDVKVVDSADSLIIPADNKHICLVPENIATVSAQGALSNIILSDGAVAGSRYDIGSPTKQLVNGEFWWIFPLEFSGYSKWNQDNQVPGYIKVSAEDPLLSPQAVQLDANNQEIHIKYLNSACFEYNARRYLHNNGYMFNFLSDWTFEVDDQWRPYYSITISERKFGFDGCVTKGVVLLDVQTGDLNYYDLSEVPSWVDRVMPETTVSYNAYNWGLYGNESYNYVFWNKDKSQQPSSSWYLTYSGDDCQWFSGFTSYSSDSALTGIMTVDARSGSASFFKTNGVTEDIANQTATGLWSDFGYESNELIVYNIYGKLTYVIPMSYNDQFVGVSLICLDNINIKAKGKTLDEALKNYKAAFSSSGVDVSPTTQSNDVVVIDVVERVGAMNGSGLVYFKLNNIGRVFQVSLDISPEVALMQVGDQISVTYSDTNETILPVKSFDNLNITLDK